MEIVLASTSLARRKLLKLTQLPIQIVSPNYKENFLPDQDPQITTERLALAKAQSVCHQFDHACIIGADQLAFFEGILYGKPHTQKNAHCMLGQFSGKIVHFYTAIALVNTVNGHTKKHCEITAVHFRALSSEQIDGYLTREKGALHCAGALKAEGLGAQLIRFIRSNDLYALTGLPIFKLIDLLEEEGFNPLTKG